MRHRLIRTRLNRDSQHRKATMIALARAVLIHQSITTTKVKARESRKLVEKLITIAKVDSLHSRRKVFAVLRDDELVKRLFSEIAPLFAKRVGGYTRVINAGFRRGDGAPIAILELVEKIKELDKPKKKKGKKSKASGPEKADEQELPAEHHKSAPDITEQKKEERTVEDAKRSKAKSEQQKVKGKGIFKNFFNRKTGS